jgi:uncharacterized membrane protein YeaQ/YmgE (transglycosylase-associated protein family)
MIGSIISWAVFGLVVGAIARFLYPGRVSMGLLMTMVLGIIGSLVGGFITYLAGYDSLDGPFQGSGWIMSILGAIIVVWLGLFASSRGSQAA